MYLHLGSDTVIKTKDIVGIFDMDNTSVSKHTRNYLSNAQKQKRVINVSFELPKSYIVCFDGEKETVYISQIAPSTLIKRLNYMKSNFNYRDLL